MRNGMIKSVAKIDLWIPDFVIDRYSTDVCTSLVSPEPPDTYTIEKYKIVKALQSTLESIPASICTYR